MKRILQLASIVACALGACDSPEHTSDGTGVPDAAPVETAPGVTITAPAEGAVVAAPVAVTFSSPTSGASFECRLDGGPVYACSSPLTFTNLDGGPHLIAVHAVLNGRNGTDAVRAFTVNTTGPVIALIASPASGVFTQQTSATFSWTATGIGDVFSCSMDGAPLAPCASPQVFPGPLAEGPHHFAVEGTAADGVASAPAEASFTVDTIKPDLKITSTPNAITPATIATFTFDVTDASPVATSCLLDSGNVAACASPVAYGSATALVSGSHTFTVKAADDAGNESTKSYTWIVDTSVPLITLTGQPASPTRVTGATLGWTTDKTVASASCVLDGGAPVACGSGTSGSAPPYGGLADATHTFEIAVTDAAGHVAKASYTWTVDTTKPVVGLGSHPAAVTNHVDASFDWTVNEAGSQICQLDSRPAAPCSGAMAYSSIADGPHTFMVSATDAAGNVGTASYSWTIDTSALVITLAGVPATRSSAATATFSWRANEAAASASCALDGGAPVSCIGGTSPAYTNLVDGPHTFSLSATDAATNSATATFHWTVDTMAPVIAAPTGPSSPSKNNQPSLGFSASDAPAGATLTYTCGIDVNPPTASCGSATGYTPPSTLADGPHTFYVKVCDDAQPAANCAQSSFGPFTIDATKPVVTFTAQPSAVTSQGDATFTWSVIDRSNVTETCQLDTQPPTPCAGTQAYSTVSAGAHTFNLTVTDFAGNATSASASWRIDLAKPVLAWTTKPALRSSATDVTFGWSMIDADDPTGVTSACIFDGVSVTCTDATSYLTTISAPTGTVTPHTFKVVATDPAGNNSSLAYSWTIDRAAPIFTTQPNVPSGVTNQPTQTISFVATDDGNVTFRCGTTVNPQTPCSSPWKPTLPDGTYTFYVTALDDAQPTPNSFTFVGGNLTVDTTKPTITFGRTPGDGIGDPAFFTWDHSDATALTAPLCLLDGLAVTCDDKAFPPAGVVATTPLDGIHSFSVSYTDQAGYTGSASYTWRSCSADTYVDAVHGSDANAGTCAAPYKTITTAVAHLSPGQLAQVLPGSYDAANGETFPIVVPSNVELRGDQSTRGLFGPTAILGQVTLKQGAMVSGFLLRGPGDGTGVGLYVPSGNVTLTDNTVTGFQYGVYVESVSAVIIQDNNLIYNTSDGIFLLGGADATISGNHLIGNRAGISSLAPRIHLTSPGQNTFSCNSIANLSLDIGSLHTLDVSNNVWDHAIPTSVRSGGGSADIVLASGTASNPGASQQVGPWVDAVNGNDSNAGTCSSPYKSIMHALGQTANREPVIRVRPGSYDTGMLWTTIPNGVTIQGDYLGAAAMSTHWAPSVQLGSNTTISGLWLSGGIYTPKEAGVAVSSATIRNSYLDAGLSIGGLQGIINIYDGAQDVRILNDVIKSASPGTTVIGVYVEVAGDPTRTFIQHTTIAHNAYGVRCDGVANVCDLGSAMNEGQNTLCGSAQNNLVATNGANNVVTANNNAWDHAPPTVGVGAAADISNAAYVTTVGASKASVCP